jgi:hypothetical protein
MKDFLLKRTFLSRFADGLDEVELEQPDYVTVLKVVWFSIRSFFVERPGQIIGSAFVLIILWGTHGKLEWLKLIWPNWRGPGVDVGNRPQLLPGIPWDNELISFWAGAFLLVVIPILIIKFRFKQPLVDYGLGLPGKGRRLLAWWTFLTVTLVTLPFFVLGARDANMQMVYPFYRPFSGVGQFLLYELTYLPFFIAIEFIFRGYLLFGLAGVRDDEIGGGGDGLPGIFYFHRYALLIQMLSYTAWHLGKPLPETWGTVVWGLAAGATAYAVRSIWPIVLSHWLLNVLLDALIVGLV